MRCLIYGRNVNLNFPSFRVVATATDKNNLPSMAGAVFPNLMELEPYSPREMNELFKHLCNEDGMLISKNAETYLDNVFNEPTATVSGFNLLKAFMNTRELGKQITVQIIDSALATIYKPTAISTEMERKPISSEVKREVWRRDLGKCTKCGSRYNLEYDHIIPVVKGGSNTTRNIELLCEPCNRSKSASI